jgi:NAD+ synthase (glutamine-hydrolysing)
MKITIAQLNPLVGDLEGNYKKLENAIIEAKKNNSELVVFSELFITGYPPKDLLIQPGFLKEIEEINASLLELSEQNPEIALIVGLPKVHNKKIGVGLYNSAAFILQGKIRYQNKTLLPTYDVFDENRYFDPGSENEIIEYKQEKIGVTICEDAWLNSSEDESKNRYDKNPIENLVKKGATLLINIAASPFRLDIQKERFNKFEYFAEHYKQPFIFVNQVGANDDLVFDGNSLCFNSKGQVIESAPSFAESIITFDLYENQPKKYSFINQIENIKNALVLGIRDYIRKCGFSKVVIGLSGGIDSAVVSYLACEAIGKENVIALSMPSKYSSQHSYEDAKQLADNLDIAFQKIPISAMFDQYINILSDSFQEEVIGVTEENIQARIRGNILMAYSNKYSYLVLSTGNKSELAVGYCTLYGDMCGGLCVLADVPKTIVFELAKHFNKDSEIIPENIITKPPSAELRPDQTDQDTLPPYNILDDILYKLIDEKKSKKDIIDQGYDQNVVNWIVKALKINEYKRAQAPIGIKISTRAFGFGRRMPIAAKK